jgi:hypothetical protein
MATTIKLGNRPKSFKPFPVKFEMPDGTEGQIVATYKYRTRTEFGEFMDAIFAEAGGAPMVDGKLDYKRLYEQTRDRNADHLLAALDAWNLDEELNLQNLQALADELPAAAIALMSSYRDACVEGRLGN